MKSSKQARRDARQWFASCLVKGELDENRVRQTVRQVIEARPRGYLGILAHFQRFLRLELERRAARVESAVVLPAQLQADVQTRLGQIYKKPLDYSFSQNPALLGGLRIKVGSDVYDGSIQSRLNALLEGF